MWLARDKNGCVYAHKNKPIKVLKDEVWESDFIYGFSIPDTSDIKEIKWEDDEPTEVKLVKK